MGALSIAADAAYLLTGVALFALGATPLSILLGVIFYLFIMNTGYQFSKFVSSAGSYYKFAALSLGGTVGTFQAWNMIFYTTLGYGSFGFLGLASFITLIDPKYSLPEFWIPVAVAAALVSFLLTYFGIRASTDYQILGGLIEVGVIIAGSIAIIVSAGHSNTLEVFTTSLLPGGVSQLFYSMIYSVVLFFGTTLSVTSLAEETREPEKSVTRALITTTVIAGFTLVLVSYAFTVGWGPRDMSSFATSPDPGLILFREHGVLLYALLIAVTVNSFMGYNIAVSNSNSRVYYTFARDGILFLPRSLARVHSRYGSPHVSATFVLVASLVVALAFGLAFGPAEGGLLMLYANGYCAYLEHIVASIGLPVMARKRGQFRVVQHLLFPAVAVGVLGAVIFFSFYPSPPAYPFDLAAYIGVAWIPFSAIMATVEYRLHPERVLAAGRAPSEAGGE